MQGSSWRKDEAETTQKKISASVLEGNPTAENCHETSSSHSKLQSQDWSKEFRRKAQQFKDIKYPKIQSVLS